MSKKNKQLSEDEFSEEFFSDDDEDSYAPESEEESADSDSDVESARPASPFSPLVKIQGVNDKEFMKRNKGLAADDFSVKRKLFERGYKSDAGSEEDSEEMKDFIEESKPKKSAPKKASAPRKSKTDYSDEESDYHAADGASESDDDDGSRSQDEDASNDSDADDLTSRMATMKLSSKQSSKYDTKHKTAVPAKKSSTASKPNKHRNESDSESDEDKENDRHKGNSNRAAFKSYSKDEERVVKKEIKKVETVPEPKKPMNAYAIYVKARTTAVKLKHPHSNGTTIKEIINSEWADLELKTKEMYQKKAREDKRRYECEMLEWKNQMAKVK